MKNTLIGLLIIIILAGLGYWWWSEQQTPALETVPQDENGIDVQLNGEVQGAWDTNSKDGAADTEN